MKSKWAHFLLIFLLLLRCHSLSFSALRITSPKAQCWVCPETVIFFPPGSKTICSVVNTWFALGILSSCPVCEMVTFTTVTRQLSWLPSTVQHRSKWLPSGWASAHSLGGLWKQQYAHGEDIALWSFEGGEHIVFQHMEEWYSEKWLRKGKFPLWQKSAIVLRFAAPDNRFGMYVMSTWLL